MPGSTIRWRAKVKGKLPESGQVADVPVSESRYAKLDRRWRGVGKRQLRNLFEIGQRLGFDVLPRHFYSSVPDIRELRASQHWREPHSMYGILGAGLDEQVAFLDECCRREGTAGAVEIYRRACESNGAIGFGPIEAAVLYRFVVEKKPRRVVQIGAGVATSVVLAASDAAAYNVEITCIDPHPTAFLRRSAASGRIRLIEERAQTVPFETLLGLSAGDLFFVDSTHTVKPGSEVNRLILEVLPRLGQGAYIHFHDIYFPYDHGPGILSEDLFFWNETALLHAFLINNSRVRLRMSLSMIHHSRPDSLKRWFPDYCPHPPRAIRDGLLRQSASGHFPSSAYLQVMTAPG